MIKPERCLIAGGVISALISILHVILAFKPELYRHIVAGQESALGQMAEQGSSLITAATVALASMFAFWALYAFSGAGLTGPLPLLRVALVAIGGVYVLRSLFILTEMDMVLNQGYPFRFVIYSTISLVTGLLYLIGILRRRAL